jgi:hypothetical protein
VKWTELERSFRQGRYKALTLEDYMDLLAEFLAHIDPRVIIHRISAYCPKDILVAPDWVAQKNIVENSFSSHLKRKGYFQGCLIKDKKPDVPIKVF